MSILGARFESWGTKVEGFDDTFRGKVVSRNLLLYPVDKYGRFDWLRVANGVGQVYKYLVGFVFLVIIDSNLASDIGARTVYFCAVFAAKCSPTEWDAGPVVINHKFSASES